MAMYDDCRFRSLVFSHNSNHHVLGLATDGCSFERGPRYEAYARLRESKLRMKRNYEDVVASPVGENREELIKAMPSRKQVKFSCDPVKTRKGSSIVAHSVPDFSSVLRKENRKPRNPNTLPQVPERTPPSLKTGKMNRNGGVSTPSGSTRGSRSVGATEKSMGLGLARKSYANVEDLKRISAAAASAIRGENRGRRAGGNRTVLGYRHF